MVRGGRNRNGGGGSRGRGRGGSSRGRAGGGPQNSEFPENKHHGFSLADEAKNTGRHHGEYSASALRHSKVSFVAAGHLDSTELFKPLNADGPRPPTEQMHDSTDATEEDDPLTSEGPENSLLEVSTGLLPQDVDMENLDLDPPEPLAFAATTSRSPKEQAPVQAFVVDIVGDPSLRPNKQIPIRSPSPGSVSSSGSEKIVFVPRRLRLGPVASRASPPMKSRATPRIPSPRLPAPREQSSMPTETVETATSSITIDDPVPKFTAAAIIHSQEDVPTHKNPFPSKFSGRATQGNKRRRHRHRKKYSSDDDAVIEDYIENITATIRAEAAETAAAAHALETGESSTALDDVDIAAPNSKTNHRELGAEDDWSTDSDEAAEAAEDSDAVNKYKAEQLWEEHELADFDGVSTSSEGLKGVVGAVLGKRVRPSGTQYLVQWRGLGTDDSTWVLAETLDSSADAKIETYEATRVATSSDGGNDEDQDSDEEQDVDSDLRLARLLQRQEVLGITDSDLELNVELDGLTEFESAAFISARKKERKAFLSEIAPNAATGFFPSASRLADAYDDFDPMDWERPSLSRGKKQKKGKGKGKVAVPDLSDEELQDTLRSSWMKDREKKKTRNAEREALRAEGLLGGGRHGKRDLKAKYKDGIMIEELQTEIREFLMGENQSLELPPMDKSARKTVHEIASAFGIKSRSFGSNRMRFPVLYKTTRTAIFTDENSIKTAMMNRRSLNRPPGRRGGGVARPAKGGAGGVVHHREGDIVGGSAPEIGIENRGRRMLEKMGYVSGMALGVEGREGIVKPVEAVVKISKAGLG